MRMRKLGKGQSVMFCGPMEVERKILHCSGKTQCDTIEVADVLQWSISTTCINTKKCIPLWATQGIRRQRRHIACSESSNDGGKGAALEIAKSLLEAEAQTLQDRYEFGGRRSEEQVLLQGVEEVALSKRETQVEAIRAKCREFGLISLNNATLREEQERELSPENEQERQVERPPALTPKNHSVHPDVKRFVHQGILDRFSDAFQPAFELFGNTSAIECLEKETWPVHLLITADFAQTVHASGNQLLDSFLRPVHWVASGKRILIKQTCHIPDSQLFKASLMQYHSTTCSISGSARIIHRFLVHSLNSFSWYSHKWWFEDSYGNLSSLEFRMMPSGLFA